MERTFDIFFSDLVPESQKEVLMFLGLKKPADGNLDVFPLTVISQEDEEKFKEEVNKNEKQTLSL